MKSFIRLFVIGIAVFFISIALFPFATITAVAQEKAESAVAEEQVSQKKNCRRNMKSEL
jgi:hypothetical protein